MSRKQEIYRELLRWALPSTRNSLSQFHRIRPLVVLSPNQQRVLNYQYEVAEFLHNLFVSILEEEFTEHDVWFLNHQARGFYEWSQATGTHIPYAAGYIQELINEVPECMKEKLLWSGPEAKNPWESSNRGGNNCEEK